MKNKWIVGIMIFSLSLNLAVIGNFAYRYFNKPDYNFRDRFNRGLQREGSMGLELNEEQRSKLFELMRSFHENNREQRIVIRQLEKELLDKITSGSPKPEIDTLLKNISDIKFEQSKKALLRFYETKSFLNPEQQKRILQMFMHNQPFDGRGFERGRRFRNNEDIPPPPEP